jgi:hypothetical protein
MTIFGKEIRVFLKGQAKEAFIELKKRKDKQSFSSIDKVKNA